MGNSDRLMEVLAPAFGSHEFQVDEAALDRMVAAVGPIAAEDFICRMVAMNVTREFEGADGVKAAWMDWIEAYSELHFRIGEVRDIGENVLMEATQVGLTRHDDVVVEQPSAAVWRFRAGRLYRVEFHLDRRAAERSAQSGQE